MEIETEPLKYFGTDMNYKNTFYQLPVNKFGNYNETKVSIPSDKVGPRWIWLFY